MRRYLAYMFVLILIMTGTACAQTTVEGFQPAGDTSYSIGSFFDVFVELDGTTSRIYAGGDTVINRSDPVTDPVTGVDSIVTRMLNLNLVGTAMGINGPIPIGLNPNMGDAGGAGGAQGAGPGVDYPADSFFDIFFEIELPNGALHNTTAAHMQGHMDSFFDIFVELSAPVDLYDPSGVRRGQLTAVEMRITPEPSSVLALASGLLPLGFAIRRSRARR